MPLAEVVLLLGLLDLHTRHPLHASVTVISQAPIGALLSAKVRLTSAMVVIPLSIVVVMLAWRAHYVQVAVPSAVPVAACLVINGFEIAVALVVVAAGCFSTVRLLAWASFSGLSHQLIELQRI